MDWIMRILWALGMAVLAWLICIFFGGFLATVDQPQMAYVGSFLNKMATIVAVVVFILAFVGGAPGSLVAYFHRPAAQR
jgi:hypothetical protein